MNTVIWLKTARVYGSNDDMTPKIERTIIKLENGDNFNKFVKHMHLKGYMKSEPPTVDRVLQKDDKGVFQEIDKAKWQKQVEEALQSNGIEKPIDYKALSEKQNRDLKELKANNNAFEERLKALEAKGYIPSRIETEKRELLLTKATELKIKFSPKIGDVKLLEKIQAVEPDFKL